MVYRGFPIYEDRCGHGFLICYPGGGDILDEGFSSVEDACSRIDQMYEADKVMKLSDLVVPSAINNGERVFLGYDNVTLLRSYP